MLPFTFQSPNTFRTALCLIQWLTGTSLLALCGFKFRSTCVYLVHLYVESSCRQWRWLKNKQKNNKKEGLWNRLLHRLQNQRLMISWLQSGWSLWLQITLSRLIYWILLVHSWTTAERIRTPIWLRTQSPPVYRHPPPPSQPGSSSLPSFSTLGSERLIFRSLAARPTVLTFCLSGSWSWCVGLVCAASGRSSQLLRCWHETQGCSSPEKRSKR